MSITKVCEDPTSAGVWWRDDAEWKQYNATHSAAILQGVKDGVDYVELENLVSSTYGGGASYVLDVVFMKQLNLTSGHTRDVKVLPAPDRYATPGHMERVKAFQNVMKFRAQFIPQLIQFLKEEEEDPLAVKNQATRNEQVESLPTSPEQTN